jgi:peptide/nickel transport system substrate-binding protein
MIPRRTLLTAGIGLAAAGCAPARIGLRIATPQLPAQRADPFMGLTLPHTLTLDAIYDSMTRLEPLGEAAPALARAWRMEDQVNWVFDLRSDALFSNGRKLDAEAVEAAMALLRSGKGKTTSAGSDLAAIIDARAVGPLSLRVTTATPNPLLPASLSVLKVPDAAALKEAGWASFASDPVGSGPFQLRRWTPQSVILAANPSAWRRAAAAEIEIAAIPDETARLQALVSGAVDVALQVSPDDATTLERAGARLVQRMTTSVALIAFITNRGGPLADVRVREALNLAIDRERMISLFLANATHPAGQIASADGFGAEPALAMPPHDPDRARALLAAAGLGQGLRLTLVCVTGLTPNDSAIYQQVASECAEIGIRIELRRIPMASFQQHLFSGGWPGDMFAIGMGGFDALRSFRLLSCQWPAAWHCDPAVGALVKVARSAPDRATRREATRAVLRADRASWSALYLWGQVVFDAVAGHVGGYTQTRATLPLETLHFRVAS